MHWGALRLNHLSACLKLLERIQLEKSGVLKSDIKASDACEQAAKDGLVHLCTRSSGGMGTVPIPRYLRHALHDEWR